MISFRELYISLGLLVIMTTGVAVTACSYRCSKTQIESRSRQYPKDLRELSVSDRRQFFNSFDTVITDMDETLWYGDTPISGAIESLKQLRTCGKKILFLTNNVFYTKEHFASKLQSMDYNVPLSEITLTSDALIWYLKQVLKFNGTAFVIGTEEFVKLLEENGIKTVTTKVEELSSPFEIVHKSMDLVEDVKAVIINSDANLNYVKITQAAEYVKRKDVIFLVGPLETKLFVSQELTLIAPNPYVDKMISERTGKISKSFGKPGEILRDYIINNYSIKDPGRVLFIGDSLEADMAFADLCKFKKLWVTSGLDNVKECDNGCKQSPDYYLPDLGKMPPCIE